MTNLHRLPTDNELAPRDVVRAPQDPVLGFTRVIGVLCGRNGQDTVFGGWGPRVRL